MKNIKYKIWNKKDMKMSEVFDLFNTPEELIEAVDEDTYELLQLSGIKDTNGVEIADGDILKLSFIDNVLDDHKEIEQFIEVYFTNGAFKVAVSPRLTLNAYIELVNDAIEYEPEMEQKCVVIGNKYENPEIMENVITIPDIYNEL